MKLFKETPPYEVFGYYLVIFWNFFKPFTVKESTVDIYKMIPHLLCYLIKTLRNLTFKI